MILLRILHIVARELGLPKTAPILSVCIQCMLQRGQSEASQAANAQDCLFTVLHCRCLFTVLHCRCLFAVLPSRCLFTVLHCRCLFAVLHCSCLFTVLHCRLFAVLHCCCLFTVLPCRCLSTVLSCHCSHRVAVCKHTHLAAATLCHSGGGFGMETLPQFGTSTVAMICMYVRTYVCS